MGGAWLIESLFVGPVVPGLLGVRTDSPWLSTPGALWLLWECVALCAIVLWTTLSPAHLAQQQLMRTWLGYLACGHRDRPGSPNRRRRLVSLPCRSFSLPAVRRQHGRPHAQALADSASARLLRQMTEAVALRGGLDVRWAIVVGPADEGGRGWMRVVGVVTGAAAVLAVLAGLAFFAYRSVQLDAQVARLQEQLAEPAPAEPTTDDTLAERVRGMDERLGQIEDCLPELQDQFASLRYYEGYISADNPPSRFCTELLYGDGTPID